MLLVAMVVMREIVVAQAHSRSSRMVAEKVQLFAYARARTMRRNWRRCPAIPLTLIHRDLKFVFTNEVEVQGTFLLAICVSRPSWSS
jgi:hypothetical protein